jgi:DNA-binding PadR family transcriptional regulator
MDGMTPELWAELDRAARGYDSGLDLRFEPGRFLTWLDTLVDMGLVNFEQGDPGYFVSYTITPKGTALLEDYRKNHPPQA